MDGYILKESTAEKIINSIKGIYYGLVRFGLPTAAHDTVRHSDNSVFC